MDVSSNDNFGLILESSFYVSNKFTTAAMKIKDTQDYGRGNVQFKKVIRN